MRHLGDYLTRRVLGYLAVAAVAALLAVVVPGTARAQTRTITEAHALCQAYSAEQACVQNQWFVKFNRQCNNFPSATPGVGNIVLGGTCEYLANGQTSYGNPPSVAWAYQTGCPAGKTWNASLGSCTDDCSVKPPVVSGFTPPNGSIVCDGGCTGVYNYNGDGTSTATYSGATCDGPNLPEDCETLDGYYWHSTLNVCAPVDPPECEEGQDAKEGVCNQPDPCPEGMVEDAGGLCKPEKEECPPGNIKSPSGACLPGDNQCAAGEVRGPDGTCKKDADGDGEPDPPTDEDGDGKPDAEFSGGDSCDVPPTCSGDAIMCGQARIQWRIDCNTRRNRNIAGGSCAAVPICTGEKCDALEYASLLQQWRTACHLEKMVAQGPGEGGGSEGDANGNGIPDQAEAGIADDGAGDTIAGVGTGDGPAWGDVDQGGWLGGGSCPGLPTFELMGTTFDLGTSPCEQGAVLGDLLVVFAMVMAAGILGRAAAGVS